MPFVCCVFAGVLFCAWGGVCKQRRVEKGHFEITRSDELFERLALNIRDQGYSVHTNALPIGLSQMLWDEHQTVPLGQFKKAGVGRNGGFVRDEQVRRDKICWIEGTSPAGGIWNAWMSEMQSYLNAHLYLGLFSFESHYARYTDGDYYLKHQDAFVGEGNRILSIVTYLNKAWVSADAGELVLFTGRGDQVPVRISPKFGTLVVFLSEEFPHEVLATHADRLSIAGWFRANGSLGDRIDPPT